MLKSIMCTLDGSAYSESVLEHGIRLAERFNAELRLLSVIDIRMFEWVSAIALDGFVPAIPGPNYMKDSRSVLEAKAKDTLDKARERAAASTVSIKTITSVGVPGDVICDEARKVDLVLMGRRGEFAQWSGQLVGATLEAVSHIIPRPLLIVDKAFQPFEHLICAYDASECASRALKTGMDYAKHLKLPVTIVSVGDKDTTDKWLGEGREYCTPYDLNTEYIAREGDFIEVLKELRMEKGNAFVIIGSHGKSRIREAILGSTTLEVLRKVDFPVFIQR